MEVERSLKYVCSFQLLTKESIKGKMSTEESRKESAWDTSRGSLLSDLQEPQ